MLANGTWDIRCPLELKSMFAARDYYWWKINREQAIRVCEILAKAYNIPAPEVVEGKMISSGLYGEYHNGKIYMWSRNHIKTIFHEFYHHLDAMTNHEYNSDDHEGGSASYGWQFADKLFDLLRVKESGKVL